MMNAYRIVLVAGAVAALLFVAACGTVPEDTGIKGLVTIGPVSPVQQQGDSGSEPYSAAILIKQDGRTVADVISDEDGRFSVNLAPGGYVLEPQSQNTLPTAPPQAVEVREHSFTEVRVEYDSGIR